MADKLRLRQATPAVLDLRRYWIEGLEYREVDEHNGALPETSVRISLPDILESPAEVGEYLVTLRIMASQGEARSIDVTIAGLFALLTDEAVRLSPPTDEAAGAAFRRFLTFNGSAMLFSAARGAIETVTGISGYGRMHVPSVNIAELLDR